MYSTEGSSSCTACPTGFTTEASGASSAADCSLCIAGRGGSSCSLCTSGTYAVGEDDSSVDCAACPSSTTFMFQFPGVSDDDFVYRASTVSAVGSTSSAGCVAAYAQVTDDAPLTVTGNVGMTVASGVSTLAGCVTACEANSCQFLNFDYSTSSCSIRTGVVAINADNPASKK